MTAPTRPDVTVGGTELRQVLSLAMTAGHRRPEQQRALAVVAEAIDATLSYAYDGWAGMVAGSWTHTKARCGHWVSLEDDLAGCPRCADTGPLVDPLCEITAAGHVCTNRAGEPLRLGQACWPSARMQARRR